MTTNRNERITAVLTNRELIIPLRVYLLSELYSIIEKYAGLTEEDWLRPNSGGVCWKHSVRAALVKHDGIRSVQGREITYHQKTKYSFS